FLYQMGVLSGSAMAYAITAGQSQPVFIPLKQHSERNIIHIQGDNINAIPPQRAAVGGLEVFTDKVATAPGFYTLFGNQTDTVLIAVNTSRQESDLAVWTPAELEKQWPDAVWIKSSQLSEIENSVKGIRFPLWKVCITLALFMLLV